MHIFGLFSLYIMIKRLNVHRHINSMTNSLTNELVEINKNLSSYDYKLNRKLSPFFLRVSFLLYYMFLFGYLS